MYKRKTYSVWIKGKEKHHSWKGGILMNGKLYHVTRNGRLGKLYKK